MRAPPPTLESLSLDISDHEISDVLFDLKLDCPPLLPIDPLNTLTPGSAISSLPLNALSLALVNAASPENHDDVFNRIEGVLRWCNTTWEERERQEKEAKAQR